MPGDKAETEEIGPESEEGTATKGNNTDDDYHDEDGVLGVSSSSTTQTTTTTTSSGANKRMKGEDKRIRFEDIEVGNQYDVLDSSGRWCEGEVSRIKIRTAYMK